MNQDISAFIMGTCDPQRLKWLKLSIDCLDSQSFPFSKKILVIDQFGGLTLPKQERDYFEQNGWNVLVYSEGGGRDGFGRAICMLKALEHVDTEFIFYNEDDILVRMPDHVDVNSVLSRTIADKSCGMLSMNIGGSTHDFPRKKFGDLLNIQKNIILQNNKYICFLREEECASDWFVEFPALFVRKDILTQTIENTYGNGGLEIHITKKYFKLGLQNKHFKASLCKNNVFDVIDFYKHSFNYEMFETAKLTKLMDKNQGDISFNLSKIPEI